MKRTQYFPKYSRMKQIYKAIKVNSESTPENKTSRTLLCHTSNHLRLATSNVNFYMTLLTKRYEVQTLSFNSNRHILHATSNKPPTHNNKKNNK